MDMAMDISIATTSSSLIVHAYIVDAYILHAYIPHLGGGYRVRSAQGVLQGEEGPLHIVHMDTYMTYRMLRIYGSTDTPTIGIMICRPLLSPSALCD